ncbi:MAG: hypothetical protein JW969_10875 [Spirochaetales bacterium]|nr:hypothetical protein [Spirochaetales bacterium]
MTGEQNMDCREFDRQLKEILEKYWLTGKEVRVEKNLENHAGLCSRCRQKLAASMALVNGGSLKKEPPWGLSERIYARLEEKITAKPGFKMPVPAWVSIAAVFIVILAGAALFFWNTVRDTDLVTVRFILEAPAASKVAVVGDFNQWDTEKNLLSDPDNDGVWELDLTLPGNREYQYQFYLNGEKWIPDPNAFISIDDGFGGVNSILDI